MQFTKLYFPQGRFRFLKHQLTSIQICVESSSTFFCLLVATSRGVLTAFPIKTRSPEGLLPFHLYDGRQGSEAPILITVLDDRGRTIKTSSTIPLEECYVVYVTNVSLKIFNCSAKEPMKLFIAHKIPESNGIILKAGLSQIGK